MLSSIIILGGSGTSVWGYLTAGVVAANVAANLANNANQNNNNNNNNNNQDNTNNNNMNLGNSMNNIMNMNMLLPGRRSFQSPSVSSSNLQTLTGFTLFTGAFLNRESRLNESQLTVNHTIDRLFCSLFSTSKEVTGASDVLNKMVRLYLALISSDMLQTVFPYERALNITLNQNFCQM